ncbi:hypothetical protein A6B37_11030 [Achromobacter sp. HZ01]|uniref:DUF3306 domain-containing protein n=1 Tax=Achromobacter sp. HZ01 TaxID=1416886 RepID=UPI000DC52024|nr:DUF3306 domain-containing protein [Achromobacter sp. HZ01]RAP62980.1 hypothetical protein A6B37_11030 [Achromobacter sp. HZ01]
MSETRHQGFLQRWSRRKIEAREGGPEEPAPAAEAPAPVPAQEAATPPAGLSEAAPAEPELPTMDDVLKLTADSDFSRFVTQGVAPDIKNAALKKLFADPHYNVMDGLDVYIDDYSQLAPLPQSALRKMAVSRVLGFFEEEARCAASALTDAVTESPAPEAAPALPADSGAADPTAEAPAAVPAPAAGTKP